MNTLPPTAVPNGKAVRFFESRGISERDAQRLGIRWLSYEESVSRGFSKVATSPDGLIFFPVEGSVGVARNFYTDDAAKDRHLKLINQRRKSEGREPAKKTAKYLLPKDCSSHMLYDPWSALHPGSETPVLFATEDVIGVAKAALRGIRVVSTFGVWLSSKEDIDGSADVDFSHPFSGKFPAFLADSDALENPHVGQALARTGLTLHCRIGVFPANGTDKVGLDEWLDANSTATAEDLAAMLAEAAKDPMDWLGGFFTSGLSWLKDRGRPESLALKVYSAVRGAILAELLKHFSIEDLRANGFYREHLKPSGMTLANLKARAPRQSSDDSVFDLLMEIADCCKFWRTPDKQGWVDVLIDEVRMSYPIRKKHFKTWLSSELWKRHGKGSNNEAMQAALSALEARALFDGEERAVFLRVGTAEGKIYLDLGDESWRAVEISQDGWKVIPPAECPIRFVRSDGTLPLPVPVKGGSLEDLWSVVPVDQESQPLVLGWLLSCLVPAGAKPILVFTAPKGSGKSTAAATLKALIDPGKAPLLPAVGDRRDMAVKAANRWMLIFDNLTALTTDEQDAMCCTATGAGFSHRTLHTDLDETFVEYVRPQILTSVDLVPSRSDLLDRCVLVKLRPIPPEDRLTDSDLQALSAELQPRLLGALLDALVVGLRNLPSVNCPLPRMADFAKLAIAAEPAMGCQPGAFMSAYTRNIETAMEAAVEANPVAQAITELLSTLPHWEGSASSLLEELKKVSQEAKIQRLTTRGLGRMLSGSLKADLEAVGIQIDHLKTKKTRFWILTEDRQTPEKTSKTSPTSEASQSGRSGDDVFETKTSVNVTQTENVTQNVTQTEFWILAADRQTPEKTSKTSPTSEASQSGRSGDDVFETETSVNVTQTENVTQNVTQTSGLEPLLGRHRDVSDVSDVFFPPQSGAVSEGNHE